MKNLIILAALSLAIIGGLIVFKMYNKEHTDLTKVNPAYKMSASSLFDNFSNNEESANIKYLNKVLEIDGEVSKIEKSEGLLQLYLSSSDAMFGVICEMENGQSIEGIKKGD